MKSNINKTLKLSLIMGALAVTAGMASERKYDQDAYFFKHADAVTKEHYPYIARLQGVDSKDLTDSQISAATYLVKALKISKPTKAQLTATEYLKTNGGGVGGLGAQIFEPTLAQVTATAYLISKLKNTQPTLAQIAATDYLLRILNDVQHTQPFVIDIDCHHVDATAYLIGQLQNTQPNDEEINATLDLIKYEDVLNPTNQEVSDWIYLQNLHIYSLTLDFIPALRHLSSLGLPKPTKYELEAAVFLMANNYFSNPTLEQVRSIASIPSEKYNMRRTLAAHMKENPNSISPIVAEVIGIGLKQNTHYRGFEFYGSGSDTSDNILQNRLSTKPPRFLRTICDHGKIWDEKLPPTFMIVTQKNQAACGLPHPVLSPSRGDHVVFDKLIADPEDETAVIFVNPVKYTSFDFNKDGQL